MRRFILVFSLLAIVITAVVVVNLRRNSAFLGIEWRIKKPLPSKIVIVEKPQRREIIQTITAPGTIELIDEADIASQIMGQVEKVCVEKGDVVKEGDLLVKLDAEDANARMASTEARIERLKAAIDSAEADLEKATQDAVGYHQLEERGFSSPTEVRDGETMLTKMEASLEMRKHELLESLSMRRNSEQEVERTEIRAPMDGTVVYLNVEVGEVVIAGTTNLPGTVLMSIGDMSKMRVKADVDETDVGLVAAGQRARIYMLADQSVPVPGAVDLISPKGTRFGEVVSFETLINVDEEKEHKSLRPEMTATVEIEVKRADNALSLPGQAVVHRRLRDLPERPEFEQWVERQPVTPSEKGKDPALRYITVVFVYKDGVARARPVQTGISDQEWIEILDGVQEDEQIIVGPFRSLDEMVDGSPVQIEKPAKTPTDTRVDGTGDSKDGSDDISEAGESEANEDLTASDESTDLSGSKP